MTQCFYEHIRNVHGVVAPPCRTGVLSSAVRLALGISDALSAHIQKIHGVVAPPCRTGVLSSAVRLALDISDALSAHTKNQKIQNLLCPFLMHLCCMPR